MSTLRELKAVLRKRFTGITDRNGYTSCPQDNLIHGIDIGKVEADLRRGDGNELRTKFCAVHSSSALAVNCFAPFKDHPADLKIVGKKGAANVEFEKKMTIFRGGRPPNIDVWIERSGDVVAVESKLLEYLTPKKPQFSLAYERLAPPTSETCWWRVYNDAKEGAKLNLDRAQLIKHYFGLNTFRLQNPKIHLTLLYLFWEPMNSQNKGVFAQHRKELREFTESVSDSKIRFGWTTYNDLWEEWGADPALKQHAQNLKERYEVKFS